MKPKNHAENKHFGLLLPYNELRAMDFVVVRQLKNTVMNHEII